MPDLTTDQFKFLKDCKGGADIWGYAEAKTGRELERLGLITVTSAKANVPGEKRLPYFGAITNKAGHEVLEKIETLVKIVRSVHD